MASAESTAAFDRADLAWEHSLAATAAQDPFARSEQVLARCPPIFLAKLPYGVTADVRTWVAAPGLQGAPSVPIVWGRQSFDEAE